MKSRLILSALSVLDVLKLSTLLRRSWPAEENGISSALNVVCRRYIYIQVSNTKFFKGTGLNLKFPPLIPTAASITQVLVRVDLYPSCIVDSWSDMLSVCVCL